MPAIHWFVAEIDPKNAGYRVRTMPILAELRRQGVDVEIHSVAELGSLVKEMATTARAVVVSKPADPLVFLCLSHLRRQGVPVVVDLFDNYFSWSPALARRQIHWQWLRALQCASLVMTSSPYLGRVIGTLTDKPVVQVGDLVPARVESVASRQTAKWEQIDRVELLWFGIAGNPYYLAGLEDLARAAETVRTLALRIAPRFELSLTICTNRVPAIDQVLHVMRAHQVQARYVEWSETVCDDLLDASHVVLLPTSQSGFSLSKTHNRCSDALASGCLVLASPQGPYKDVGGAVFEDPLLLATALCGITRETVADAVRESFRELDRRHDLPADVRRFREALDDVGRAVAGPGPAGVPPILIASRIKAEVAKLSRTLGYLVASYANSPMNLNYDIRLEVLDGFEGIATLALSERARKSIVDALKKREDVQRSGAGDHVEYRAGSWRFLLRRDPHRIIVAEGLEPGLVEVLAQAQAQGRQGTTAQQESWFDAHVDVLTRILGGLGLSSMELATEEEGSWQPFAANADADLARMGRRLEAHWRRHAGAEIGWGHEQEEAA